MSMKIASSGLLRRSLVDIDRRFRDAYCLHYQGSGDGGSEHLWNVGQYVPYFTVQHPKYPQYRIYPT
jgi:hypothetical protein